jgi:hypothetical protein
MESWPQEMVVSQRLSLRCTLLLGNVAVNSAFPAWPLKHMAVLIECNPQNKDDKVVARFNYAQLNYMITYFFLKKLFQFEIQD